MLRGRALKRVLSALIISTVMLRADARMRRTRHRGYARLAACTAVQGAVAAHLHLLLVRVENAVDEQLLQPRRYVRRAQRADHLHITVPVAARAKRACRRHQRAV